LKVFICGNDKEGTLDNFKGIFDKWEDVTGYLDEEDYDELLERRIWNNSGRTR